MKRVAPAPSSPSTGSNGQDALHDVVSGSDDFVRSPPPDARPVLGRPYGGNDESTGAVGELVSLYIYDPDENLVELSNPVES